MVMVKGLNITHSVVNTHYNTVVCFFLRKLFDIADRISHDSSPAINIYKNFITHGCNILDHGVEVRLKTSKLALMIQGGGMNLRDRKLAAVLLSSTRELLLLFHSTKSCLLNPVSHGPVQY